MDLSDSGLIVTKHAIDRYKERTGKDLPDEYIADRIRSSIRKAKEVKHKNSILSARSLIDHGYEKAIYFKYRKLIFVIVDNTVVTVHKGQANYWK
jgi:hypothetical protein